MQFIIKAYDGAYYKRIADWKIVSRLLPTAILGFFLAIGVDNMIPNGQFRGLMGWTLMLALAVMICSKEHSSQNCPKSRISQRPLAVTQQTSRPSPCRLRCV